MGTKEIIRKDIVVKNSVWKLLESFGSKGVSMLVSIVLARLLMPEDYGVIALTAVFTNLTDILIQAGFSTALIQKEDVDDADYSTVFGISMISAIVLYGIIFFSAPFVATVYETPVLTSVLRVLTLSLFCQAFTAVRTAVVTRQMRFKHLFFCTIISNVISGFLGIICAYFGLEVWALVIQQLSQQVLLTVIMFATIRIKVRFSISLKSIKEIVPFSLKVLTSSLLSFIGDTMLSVVIGKVYSVADLGFYEKGAQFPRQFSLYTFSAVSNVFLPVFSSYNNNYYKLNEVFQRVVNVCCYIIIPLMAGLCMTAEPFISLLLTDKWLESVGILRWFCLYYVFTPISLAFIQLNFAIGKGETRIKSEIVRIILLFLTFIFTLLQKVPIETIAACFAIIQIISTIVMVVATVKETKFSILTFLRNLVPTIIGTGLMCLGIYLVSMLEIENVLIIFIFELGIGMFIFLLVSLILHNKAYYEVVDMVFIIFKRRN